MSNEQPTASGGSELPDELARWAQPLGVPGAKFIPAWLRPHRGEQRWSVLAVIVLVIGLQLALPDKFVLRPRTAAPSIEAALCLVLAIRNPVVSVVTDRCCGACTWCWRASSRSRMRCPRHCWCK